MSVSAGSSSTTTGKRPDGFARVPHAAPWLGVHPLQYHREGCVRSEVASWSRAAKQPNSAGSVTHSACFQPSICDDPLLAQDAHPDAEHVEGRVGLIKGFGRRPMGVVGEGLL